MSDDSAWNQATDRVLTTRLSVLVLGPSPSSPAGELRVRLRDSLRRENPADEVDFPEDLIERNPVLRAIASERSLFDAEAILVEAADAVIVVRDDDPRAS